MAPKKGKTAAAPENVSLGPQTREGTPAPSKSQKKMPDMAQEEA